MKHSVFHLSNGIRIIFHPQISVVTHTCMIVNAGSRDEDEGIFGMAHLIEHMLFKRTKRRSTSQIINRIESVGGELNAYTTKEYTCIHASVLNSYLDRALDLLEDIVFHSTFPENEIAKEKEVIVDEIASYLDSPEDSIMDDFEDLLYKGSGLGHNILGTNEDLKKINSRQIFDFIGKNYRTNEIVIGITGNYKAEKVEKLVNKLFGSIIPNISPKTRNAVIANVGQHIEIEKPIHQVHYMLGVQSYGMRDQKKIDLLLLNNIVGGMGMGSILNLAIREKYGIAYTIDSHYSIYTDTGVFSIYMGTDEEKAKKAVQLIYKELNKLKDKPISDYKLIRAKQKFKGQIALAEENRLAMIISEAKNILDYNRVIGIDEIFDQIDAVSAEGMVEVAQEIFDDDKLFSLRYSPIE